MSYCTTSMSAVTAQCVGIGGVTIIIHYSYEIVVRYCPNLLLNLKFMSNIS